jgi:hypothetical protein
MASAEPRTCSITYCSSLAHLLAWMTIRMAHKLDHQTDPKAIQDRHRTDEKTTKYHIYIYIPNTTKPNTRYQMSYTN